MRAERSLASTASASISASIWISSSVTALWRSCAQYVECGIRTVGRIRRRCCQYAYAANGRARQRVSSMLEVLAPSSSEQAAAFVREAAVARRRIKLSAQNMTAVSEYEPADLVISVHAGATLADIARAAAPHNQFLALDPAVDASTTIGSIVATNAAGPLRLAHGTPRDQVLGLEVVTGDGRVLEFGGKVVKNVAGYDIVRLLIGSRGALGFITRVNIRLKPSPAFDRTAILTVDSYD